MLQVIEIFKELTAVRRCSHHAEAMRCFLLERAALHGYETAVDAAGNVLCTTEGSRITLQAHYDMVCIGQGGTIVIEEEEGWLTAAGSTLGADNGIGMAMMLALMAEGAKVDALFTADEEVGLLGARALEVPLKTPFLLNLDSEEEGVVTIGCAGGVDIVATLPLRFEERELFAFEVEVAGLPGGHSGVDIDKPIPNAIKELAALLDEAGAELCSIGGGERRNAIARRAMAVVASPQEHPAIRGAKPLGRQRLEVMAEGAEVIAMLHGFEHGVRAFDEELGMVMTSINLAQADVHEGALRIQLNARSMRRDRLEAIEAQTREYFESFGCRVSSDGFYPPWTPQTNGFAAEVLEASKATFAGAAFGAIHAGLECGIIKERHPAVEMASVGPNIRFPHSVREKVEIASVGRVFEVVRRVVSGEW